MTEESCLSRVCRSSPVGPGWFWACPLKRKVVFPLLLSSGNVKVSITSRPRTGGKGTETGAGLEVATFASHYHFGGGGGRAVSLNLREQYTETVFRRGGKNL